MTWRTLPLDAIKSSTPYAFVGGPFGSELTTRDYVDEGVPVIRGNNLPSDVWFHDDDYVFVSETKADDLRSNTAYPGDLVFTQRGTLGQVGLIPIDSQYERYIVSQSQMKLTVDPEIADPRFVYYFFRLPATVTSVINHALTSGVPHINLSILKNFDISLPERAVQSRIADILADHDRLIENNRRRMALLERGANELYREWFVRLRFPGHEHGPVSDGVPRGWRRQTIAELCESIDYGYTASADSDEVGPKFLRITDIVPDVIDWAAVPYCPIDEDRLDKFRLAQGDIVIARTGATVGFAKRLHKRHPEAVFASYLVRLRLRPDVDDLMVGVFAESSNYKAYVQSRVGGAAQPNANAKVLAAATILVPSRQIQRLFREYVEPLYDERELLQLQNQRLAAARDLLLPRLMSGEIAV